MSAWKIVAEDEDSQVGLILTRPPHDEADAHELLVRVSRGMTHGAVKLGLQDPDGETHWYYQAGEDEDWERITYQPPVWSARLYRDGEQVAEQHNIQAFGTAGMITVSATFRMEA